MLGILLFLPHTQVLDTVYRLCSKFFYKLLNRVMETPRLKIALSTVSELQHLVFYQASSNYIIFNACNQFFNMPPAMSTFGFIFFP